MVILILIGIVAALCLVAIHHHVKLNDLQGQMGSVARSLIARAEAAPAQAVADVQHMDEIVVPSSGEAQP